jgi:hypothetical protein
MRIAVTILMISFTFLATFGQTRQEQPAGAESKPLALPQEKHLRNIRQLTFGGENAEAYFTELQNANR